MLKALRWQGLVFSAPLPAGLAALGGALYGLQSWLYARTQASMLDEGAYLVSGYLFATGRYRPFQDYGPWTNQMPLAFMIPGYVQALFGPGLRTGRTFALLLGFLLLLGLWVAARRLGGDWWAAGAVLAVAINPALVKMYSVLASQGLVACMLVWTLALTLRENRPLWQILLGAILAGGMALARLNLIPVLPLLLVYIFWQHGRRAGLWAALAGGLVLLLGHAAFWPGVLRMWAAWLPTGLAPFLASWRPPEGAPIWNPDTGLESRALSFLLGIRFHFVPIIGVLSALLLWPRRSEWKSASHFRASVFLALVFGILFLAHAWASLGVNEQTYDALGMNYCVFCFPVYLAFFSITGLLLIAASASSWRWQMPAWRQLAVAILILALGLGVGYSAFDPLGDHWLVWKIPRLRTFFTTGELLPGYVPLWEYLKNRAGIPYDQARRLLPSTAGLFAGLGILLAASVARRLYAGRANMEASSPRKTAAISKGTNHPLQVGTSFGALALLGFWLAGWLLSPTLALGAGYRNYDCGGDTIASYERSGAYLAERIPAGAKVYWQGGLSPAPLLYIPKAEIYPPQLNATYTFREGGEPDALVRFGFWNRELAERWLSEADFALVQERYFTGWLKATLLEPGSFEFLGQAPPTAACRTDSQIHVFRNLP